MESGKLRNLHSADVKHRITMTEEQLSLSLATAVNNLDINIEMLVSEIISCSTIYSKRKNSYNKIGDESRLLDSREIWYKVSLHCFLKQV
jgi:hypothetical protein